ncbi:hypothetical protein SEA_KEALII_68 [Arthrobacter phage KeAlii]|uniref:Uncharacterized protein n=1 Tax=Arthrobacter phage KeAlii TaxID=2885973 RepID=A0AA95FJT1_9CAUD|nr:hypothetical protein SEA_KEALII_68 [Arthrobacter phage KeAlii]
MGVEPPASGHIDLIRRPSDEEGTYVLLPILAGSGCMAVFADGSYTRWVPEGARQECCCAGRCRSQS